ncbi:MAG: peptidylprolyl isomerase [Gammaproteobacteria bacterium]|nr:peptidylprolyl isomerase [Gammaproteobacteria bacterium]
MKLRYLLLAILLLQFSTLHAAEPKAARASVITLDRILAVVNNDVITQSELATEMRAITQQLRQQNIEIPAVEVLQKQVLERLIVKHLQLQLAESTGIRVDDDTLARAINTIAKQNNITLSEFRDILTRDGFDFAIFRENIRQEIIINRLRQRQVDSRINVTDQEISDFLTTQGAQGAGAGNEYHVAQILIGLPEAAAPEKVQAAQAKAQQVLDRLRAGASFTDTAVSVSQDPQALQGGDLGWRTAAQLPSVFADVVPRMKPGDISDLIRSASGFHIAKLIEQRGGEQHIVKQTLARHILVRPNELTSDKDAQTRLEQLKQRIEGGEDFAGLARSHSEDAATAINGGALGWVNPGDLDPRFEEAMNTLKPKEVSTPFQSSFGWHIVQVMERRDHDNTEEFRRTQAREAIRQRKIEEEAQAWVRSLRDEAYVEYKTAEE